MGLLMEKPYKHILISPLVKAMIFTENDEQAKSSTCRCLAGSKEAPWGRQ